MVCLWLWLGSCAWPTAIVPDPTMRTAHTTLLSSRLNSESYRYYGVSYPTTMTTPSLDCALGITGIDYWIKNTALGWEMGVVTLDATSLTVQIRVRKNSNPVDYLRICYMVSSSTYLEIAYIHYSLRKWKATQPGPNQWLTGL